MTYEEIRQDKAIHTYIAQADASLSALGFTEHSFAHVTAVAEKAGYILQTLGYPERMVELTKIAGYLHDIGNLVNRVDHSQSGAVMAFRILDNMGFEPEEIALITTAIGNHDEGTGVPVNPMAAALILALVLAKRISARIVAPLNRLDLEKPLENDTYEELSPLLTRINQQRRQIDAQLRALPSSDG